jgi:hypothetical protein
MDARRLVSSSKTASAASATACLLPGNDHDAVGVADDDVAGQDGNAAEGDGAAEPVRAVLVRAGGGGGAGEDRHADLAEGLGIAGCPVKGEAGDAEVDGAFADQFAQECPGLVAAAGDDDDVSRRASPRAWWMPWLSPGGSRQ